MWSLKPVFGRFGSWLITVYFYYQFPFIIFNTILHFEMFVEHRTARKQVNLFLYLLMLLLHAFTVLGFHTFRFSSQFSWNNKLVFLSKNLFNSVSLIFSGHWPLVNTDFLRLILVKFRANLETYSSSHVFLWHFPSDWTPTIIVVYSYIPPFCIFNISLIASWFWRTNVFYSKRFEVWM